MIKRSKQESLDHKQYLHQRSFDGSKRYQAEFMRIMQQEEEMQKLVEDAELNMAIARAEEEFARMDI